MTLRERALNIKMQFSSDSRDVSSLFRWSVVARTVLLACLITAAAIRVGLSRYSPWYDELASVFFASQPVHRLWSAWMLRETNPPLYYSILKIWTDLFGTSVVSLRLPSIIASLIAIGVTYKGVCDRFGVKAGTMSAVLLTLSSQQLFFSHEIRAYIFLYTAVSVSFFGLLQIIQKHERSRAGWICYTLGSIAGVYFHTTAFLWPAAATLALIAVDRRFLPVAGDRWLSLVLADAAILLGGSWWLYMTVEQLLASGSNIAWIEHVKPSSIPSLLLSNIFLMHHPGMLKVFSIGLVLLAAWGAAHTWRLKETRLTTACFTFSLLLFLALSVKQPILLDRTLLWLSIFPLVLISVAVGQLKGLPSGIIVLVLVGGLSLNLASQARHLKVEDWTEDASLLARTPSAVLLVDSESMAIAMNMACLIELRVKPCPFPIVALDRKDVTIDSWARNGMESLNLARLDPTALPSDARVYLMRRQYHDILEDLQHMAVLPSDSFTPPFAGPYPASVLDKIQQYGTWENHLLRLDQTLPVD